MSVPGNCGLAHHSCCNSVARLREHLARIRAERDDARARLAAAERDRDEADAALKLSQEAIQVYCDDSNRDRARAEAAEARLRECEAELQAILAVSKRHGGASWNTVSDAAVRALRSPGDPT